MNRISLRRSETVTAAFALLLTGGCAAPAGTADPVRTGSVAAPDAREVRLVSDGHRLVVREQDAPVTALLQAVDAVDDRVAWLGGHGGRWLRTEDGGETWFAGLGPAGDSLEFRDVEAFGAATAYLMSAGEGAASRIYRTDDGGASWRLQWIADHPGAFLDCMAFWGVDTGIAYGDAVDGTVFVLRTADGGASWERVPPERAPAALEGEGGFAASGTCAVAGEEGRGWIVTGNAGRARVLSTADSGRSWNAAEPPVVGGTGAGLVTLAAGEGGLVALGGVLHADTARGPYVAVSGDGGLSWSAGGSLAMAGPAYGAAAVPGLGGPVVVAVGPGGMDWSTDGGRSWLPAAGATYWAVAFASPTAGWAVGPGGRVVRLAVERAGGPDGPSPPLIGRAGGTIFPPPSTPHRTPT